MTGDTIKGVTREITVTRLTGPVTDPQGLGPPGFETSFSINRQDYGGCSGSVSRQLCWLATRSHQSPTSPQPRLSSQ